MRNNQEDIDHILNVVMQGKQIEPIQIKFILEDFKEGGKVIIGDAHLFEILKIENDTVLMKPIGTCVIAKQKVNFKEETIITRFIENGEIVERNK